MFKSNFKDFFFNLIKFSKRYQKDVAIRFSELSDRYDIKNSLI